MNFISTFFRYKKKSLILVYILFPLEVAEILKGIRYKKLYQCVLKEDLGIIFEETIIYGHTGQIKCLARISKTQIASAGRDRTVILWDFKEEKCLMKLTGHTNYILGISKLT